MCCQKIWIVQFIIITLNLHVLRPNYRCSSLINSSRLCFITLSCSHMWRSEMANSSTVAVAMFLFCCF